MYGLGLLLGLIGAQRACASARECCPWLRVSPCARPRTSLPAGSQPKMGSRRSGAVAALLASTSLEPAAPLVEDGTSPYDGNGPCGNRKLPWQTSAAKPGAGAKFEAGHSQYRIQTQRAAGAHPTAAASASRNPAADSQRMASDADTTYKATTPAVSSRALKCYTACYDGKLDEVKRVVNQPNQPPLDVNAEIHGGTAFAGAVQNGTWRSCGFSVRSVRM